jgi:hypothetical protein
MAVCIMLAFDWNRLPAPAARHAGSSVPGTLRSCRIDASRLVGACSTASRELLVLDGESTLKRGFAVQAERCVRQ